MSLAAWFRGWLHCISSGETEVQRRPYHRYCRCALHQRSRWNAGEVCSSNSRVSYPLSRGFEGASIRSSTDG
ncbi:hypothetical protein HPP92_017503 [Vanilla planifolia]|uniref:Uncharacterized protein n=1 Tax=Vanilla planifolia TaxID=51239 RepID=A0A835QG47_VANPL|nr:hypothetical protein HPP92_017503 [Vanilla planifolia]